jgi:hypothetical protein
MTTNFSRNTTDRLNNFNHSSKSSSEYANKYPINKTAYNSFTINSNTHEHKNSNFLQSKIKEEKFTEVILIIT